MRFKTDGIISAFCVAASILFGCARQTVAPQKLAGLWHKVESGDTVASVSKRYATDPEELMELNDLSRGGSLTNRGEIFIPKEGGMPPGTGARPSAVQVVAGEEAKSLCGMSGRPCLEWPVKGKISSGFGTRGGKHHDGIDIPAAKGTPVAAAENGKVLYSGDNIKGYGNLIIVRHENGIITIYAHNEKNLVKEGDTVKRGQNIAGVGDTGSTGANHLHFEVRVDEQPRDPLLYLPSK